MRPISLAHYALASLVAAVTLSSQPACTAVTNETAIQCLSEADCLALGPAFAGTTCSPTTKTCVQPTASGDQCTTNQECVTRAGGAAAVCIKSTQTCVALATPECPDVVYQTGQLIDDNAIIIGAMSAAHTTNDGGVGNAMLQAMQLAQADFSTQVHGLPAIGSGSARPIIIVNCLEVGTGIDYDGQLRGANHLVKDLNVPLVLGPVDQGNLQQVATQVFFPNKVLDICPSGQAIANNEMPSPVAPLPLIWSIQFNDHSIANTVSHFITEQLAPKVQAERSGPIRVALLTENNFEELSSATSMEARLTINGMTAVQNASANPPTYMRFNLGDPLDPVSDPNPSASLATVVQQVLAFKPQIIIYTAGPEAITPLLFPLTLQWPTGTPLPYTLDFTGTFGFVGSTFQLLNMVPALQSRIFSVSSGEYAEDRQAQFNVRMSEAYPALANTGIPFAFPVQSYYDAVYMAAYALTALGSKPISGAALATTLPLLNPPGTLTTTDPGNIGEAFGLLSSGMGIDIDGLGGNLNLDPTLGTVDYNVEMQCPEPDPAGSGAIVGFQPTGYYTTGSTGSSTGVYSCPGL